MVCVGSFYSVDGPGQIRDLRAKQFGRRLKLLYVMEYDGKLDWQPVQLEKGLTDDLLAWLINLHDRLTMTSQQSLGEELMASRLTFRPAAR